MASYRIFLEHSTDQPSKQLPSENSYPIDVYDDDVVNEAYEEGLNEGQSETHADNERYEARIEELRDIIYDRDETINTLQVELDELRED